MMEWVMKPWPWYVAGPLIAVVMLSLYFVGGKFGVSSTLRTLCSIGGGGKLSHFFRFDWQSQVWNLVFVAGAVIGGFVASEFMTDSMAVGLGAETTRELIAMGIDEPGATFLPEEIFSWDNLFTAQGLVFMVVGGFFVGFGTRYAGGCTSGHAITGLSNLQLPSLIAVFGFFIGGLITTYLILPGIL